MEHVQCVMIHYESSHAFHGVLPQLDLQKHEPVTRVKLKLALAGIWLEFRHEFRYYRLKWIQLDSMRFNQKINCSYSSIYGCEAYVYTSPALFRHLEEIKAF